MAVREGHPPDSGHAEPVPDRRQPRPHVPHRRIRAHAQHASRLHLAGQWGRLPAPDHPGHTIPVVFWDPKPNSDDFGPFVRSRSGRFTRLDDPSSRGILDPLRCIPDSMRDMQMQMAVAMLGQITGGMHGDRNRELALTSIIGYGMRHGADCLGECVDMAYAEYVGHGPEAGTIAPLVTDIKPMLDRAVLNDPLMPLIYATEHGGAKLSVGEGLTLISAGSLNVITEKEIDSAPSAVQRWVCRMVAIGASSLVIGRDGMFVGDEAWSLLLDDFGRSVVARMGRLGRAQHYMAFLLSQKVDEFVDAGLDDFIGKVYVMAIGAKNEGSGRDSQAEAACRLAGQPLDGRIHRAHDARQVCGSGFARPRLGQPVRPVRSGYGQAAARLDRLPVHGRRRARHPRRGARARHARLTPLPNWDVFSGPSEYMPQASPDRAATIENGPKRARHAPVVCIVFSCIQQPSA